LLPGCTLTQVLLTCEKAWLGPQEDGPAAVVVLPVVVEVAVVDVVGFGGVVDVVVGAAVWVGCACSVTVEVVLLPPQAETTSASATAITDATAAYLTDFTELPSGRRLGSDPKRTLPGAAT
jgi:hypothetical protein